MIFVLDSLVNTCSSPALGTLLSICKKGLGLIQIVGPLLLIVSLSINFIKMMSNPDEKKNKKKVINSLIATVVLFFIPMMINVVMGMMDKSFSIANCWNSIDTFNGNLQYVEIRTGETHKGFIIDPNDFEEGDERETNNGITGSTSMGTAQSYKDVVWDSNDVTRISNLTSSQLIAILNSYGGKAKNFIPYATGLIAAENKYSVNVFFLIGIEALESGWITSSISKNCNNLGGVCASSKYPSNGCGRNSNCSFAYFSTPEKFIDYHANMLHKNYLTPGAVYYNGKSPSGVVVKYCPGCSSWPGNVTTIANGLFKQTSKVM